MFIVFVAVVVVVVFSKILFAKCASHDDCVLSALLISVITNITAVLKLTGNANESRKSDCMTYIRTYV